MVKTMMLILKIYMRFLCKGKKVCLLEMKAGEIASIDALNVHGELKSRLNSLGFIRDNSICVKQFGLFKSTVQVMINRSLIALRRDEARLIEVHKI
jgi:Fe2+ transport system protein FeoA